MALLNPPGYLHNASPSVASGQMDRLISISAHLAGNAGGLNSLDGVRNVNELAVNAQGTPNMTVNVGAGIAVVDGSQNATQGAYVVINDGDVTLTIGAADATNPRRDLIIVRVYDSQYAGAANTSALEVLQGTAAASPVDPTLPPNSLVLARITVAANDTAINSGDIVDQRKFYAAPGGIVPVLNTAQRDALTKYAGLTVYRIDNQTLETWNASSNAWNSESTTSGTTGISAATGWQVTSQTWTLKRGIYTFYLQATRTGTAINSGNMGNIDNVSVATIPSGRRPLQEVGVQAGRQGRLLLGTCDAAGVVRLTSTVPNVDIANGANISLAGQWVV